MSISRAPCSPLVSWLLGGKKRVFFSLRKRCVSCPRIGYRRRFRWCVWFSVAGNRVTARGGQHFPVGALAHASRVGAAVASGGVRLPEFPRAAVAKQKAVDKGGEGMGPGHISNVGIVSAPPEAPAAFGRTARATAVFDPSRAGQHKGRPHAITPDPLVRPLLRSRWRGDDLVEPWSSRMDRA